MADPAHADDSARETAAKIVAALARLRMASRGGGFPGHSPGPPFGPPQVPHGPHGQHGPHSHQGPQGHHGHGSPGHREGMRGRRGSGPGPFGRSIARFRLLETLVDAGSPLTVTAIAERLGVDQPRASKLVQSAVDVEHVQREADPADARRTLIVLTTSGRALVAEARGARLGAAEQALVGFSDQESAQLAELLTRLAEGWPR